VLTCNDPSSLSAIYDLGVREATGRLIGFINSELRIVSPDWLREMVSHTLRPEVGAVGAKIFSENNSIEHAGMILGVRGVGLAFKGFPADSEGYVFRAQVIQNYSAVSGDCLLMRKELFTEVGGFDEETFPSNLNDVDLCLRIRSRGYRNLWTPYAEVTRRALPSGTEVSEKETDGFAKAIKSLHSRWESVTSADPCYNPNLALNDESFSFGFPPRASRPWERHGSGALKI